MTDKEKIIAYIDKLLEKYPKNYYLLTVAEFIDSLQEEPVSEGKDIFDNCLKSEEKFILPQKISGNINCENCLYSSACALGDIQACIIDKPVSEDFEATLAKEWQGYVDRGAATVDALEDNTQELAFAKGFYRGWNYPKSSVWHDANTLPSDPKAVIVEHNEYSTSICRAEQISRVKGARWAYIDDLLKL